MRTLKTQPTETSETKPMQVQTVRVVWGAETYQLKQYTSCVIGPFEAVVTVPSGASMEAAVERAYADLSALAKRLREQKLREFLTTTRGS